MIHVSVCYSNKNGQEFASASVNDIELDTSIFKEPAKLLDTLAAAYDVCEAAVHKQLGMTPDAPSDPPAVNPAAARMNAPAPAPPAVPPPPPPEVPRPSNGQTYYGNSGPPKTGKQLAGWAKGQGCLAWFEEFGRSQKPSPLPKLISQWTDQWAVYAYNQYLAAHAPATNGTH